MAKEEPFKSKRTELYWCVQGAGTAMGGFAFILFYFFFIYKKRNKKKPEKNPHRSDVRNPGNAEGA